MGVGCVAIEHCSDKHIASSRFGYKKYCLFWTHLLRKVQKRPAFMKFIQFDFNFVKTCRQQVIGTYTHRQSVRQKDQTANAKGSDDSHKAKYKSKYNNERMHKRTINTMSEEVKDSATRQRRGDRNEKEAAGCEIDPRGTP